MHVLQWAVTQSIIKYTFKIDDYDKNVQNIDFILFIFLLIIASRTTQICFLKFKKSLWLPFTPITIWLYHSSDYFQQTT